MSSEKYIGLDVQQATISVAVMDSRGKLGMESILETKAATILEFFAGLRGTLFATFEEGTWAAWLYDLLKPHVAKVLVCNPRKNARPSFGGYFAHQNFAGVAPDPFPVIRPSGVNVPGGFASTGAWMIASKRPIPT